MLNRKRSLLTLVAAFVVVVGAACSSSSKPAAPNSRTPGTLAPAVAAHAYEKAGPYPVGITTFTLDGGVKMEIWYPAITGSTGTDSYDVRQIVPQAVRNLLKANIPAVYTIDAKREAAVAAGVFPLVLFSHGASGIRQQSSFLTAHLASWGMIVAAPDHWSRDLFHSLQAVLGTKPGPVNGSVTDLELARTRMEQENGKARSRFLGHVDTKRVAAVGHSAGGGTVLRFAREPGVAGYVSMASGVLPDRFTSTTVAPTAASMPNVPSFFLAGSRDNVAKFDEVTKPAYELTPVPSRLWVIDGAGHNAFDDFCTFGNGRGIIGVAEASGLGPFLDAQPQFRRLGEDGCNKPAVPVAQTFPIVNHAVTAWLRNLFGVDPAPVGLGPEVEHEYRVPVAVSVKS